MDTTSGPKTRISRHPAWERASTAAAGGLAGAALVAWPSRDAAAESQPHMQAALSSLQNAHAQLRRATADKGGHRARAIPLVEQAIAEVRAGIAADNRR